MEKTMKPGAETNGKTTPAKETPKASSNKSKEISLGAPDIEDEIQLERREAYVEVETQKLLRELIKNETREEIVPSYDPAEGFVYKTVESILDEKTDNKNIPEFLERLTRLDILRKSFYDTISTCPNCESTALTLHTSCPKCKSHNISKTSLTEHIPCGYIGEREKYIDGKCPKCGRSLDDTPFADMGRWYMCRTCGEKFEHPQFDVICRNCDKIFQIEQADLKEISKYSIKTERKKEVRQNVASLDAISKLLTDLNFEIQMPGWAIGEKSGMRHQFSLLAKKDINGRQKLIALDMVVGETEVQASPLILYIYKTSEVTVDIPIFVAFPRFSDTAQKIAQGHNMILIEGSPEEPDNVARIKSEIQYRLEPRPATTAETPSSVVPVQVEKTKAQTAKQAALEEEKKAQVQLFSTTSTIHPEPKKESRFRKLLKGKKKEEDEE
jgi:Zn finger protein HypA/HybF involved in hydrogenase expression